MRTLWAILFALITFAAGGGAWAGCTLSKIAELPVAMEHGSPIVSAQFNGRDVKLIADSGAFWSMISTAAAAQYDLVVEPMSVEMRISGVGGDVSPGMTTVETFGLTNGKLRQVQFLVGGTDTGVAGLLGRNILNGLDAEYDLGGGAIRLFEPKGCRSTNLGYWAKGGYDSVAPIERQPATIGPIVVRVIVNGVGLYAMIDSGADASVMTLKAARRAGVNVAEKDAVEEEAGWGIGQHMAPTWTAPISSFEIGGEKISNTHLQVMQTDFGGGGIDMLLGDDFLLSHRIYVANSQQKIFFTYQGGPVFNISHHQEMLAKAQALSEIDDPKSAEGFADRGAAYAVRGDLKRAMADLDKAVAMDAKSPRFLVQRADLHLELNEPIPAAHDLDAALALKPDFVEARLARGKARFAAGDRAGAADDLQVAARALAPQAELQLAVAEDEGKLGRYNEAIAAYDQWLRYHPEDARLPMALNGRCWVRALTGRELDRALSDCNRAVRMSGAAPNMLDSRGLVHLRRGEDALAVADYDAALKRSPDIAWSHYGRGLAELKAGQAAAGGDDIAMAERLDPKLAGLAARIGLPPPPGLSPDVLPHASAEIEISH